MARIGKCALCCQYDMVSGRRLYCIVAPLHAHHNMWDHVAVGVGRRVVQGGLGIDRDMWRGVFCARRWRVLPVIPRIGVKGHQACDFRGFRSPGSAWRNGKQERNFLAQNLLFVHLCASKINAGICVSF